MSSGLGKSVNQPLRPNGIYIGTITRVDFATKKVWCTIGRLTGNKSIGPLSVVGALPYEGQKAACVFTDGNDIVVIGDIQQIASDGTIHPGVHVQDVEPGLYQEGQSWFNHSTGRTYVSVRNISGVLQWVEASGDSGATGPTGPTGPIGATGPSGHAGSPLPRVTSTTSTATPSIDASLYDQYEITALATAITSVTVTNPTHGQRLTIRIKDNFTARAIAWGSSFQASGVLALPTTTVLGRQHTFGFMYDSGVSKWVIVASDHVGY